MVRTSNGSETPSASSPFLGPPGARLSAFLRSRCARTQGWSEFACCAGRIQKVRVCHSLSAFLRSRCARTQVWSEFVLRAGLIQKVPVCRSLSAFIRSRCARTQVWSEFVLRAGRIQKVRVCHSLSAFLRSQTNSECPSMSLHLAVICSLPVKSKVTWIPLHQRRIQRDPVCQNYSIVVCSPSAKSKVGCSLLAFGEIKEYLNSPASQTNSEKLWYVTCIWL